MNKSDVTKICISSKDTIRQAMENIDSNLCGLALVVDFDMRLIGTITDGDVRRAVLAGINLEVPAVELLKNKQDPHYLTPVTAPVGTAPDALLRIMNERIVRQIPIINEKQQVTDLVTLEDLLPSKHISFQAMVLAGGDASRLYPLGDDLPKPMLPVGNRPLLELTVQQLSRAGIHQIYLTTHHKTEKIVEHFGDGHKFGVEINYLDENQPRGIAGCLSMVEAGPKPLLVMSGDILTKVDFRAMLDFHQEQKASLTIAVRQHEFHIPYGVVDIQNGFVGSIAERPALKRFIDAGIYLLSPEVLSLIPQDQPYEIPSLINRLIETGYKVASFPIHEYWLDIQEYDDYQKVQADAKDGVFDAIGSTFTTLEPGAPVPHGVIPLCVPETGQKERIYIKECLDTNWVSSVGPFVNRFEDMMANYVGAAFGVATSSGTAALHTALLAAGIKPDDEVLISSLTFIAPANAIRYAGAWPVFMDSEYHHWQMDVQKLKDFVEYGCQWNHDFLYNRATGRRVAAIMPVHILGHPCDMDPILEIAKKYNLRVIEDATESLGAKYKGQPVGHLGDIACFSFNGNKIITTGGGGMIVTDNEEYARKAKYLTTQAKDDPLEFVHNEIGYNYRLTNIQAAFGCAQLERLDEYLSAKRRIAAVYTEAFKNIPGITSMSAAPWAESSFWLFTILVDQSLYGLSSRELMRHLESAGIQARPLWQPIHLSPAHAASPKIDCTIAEWLNAHALSLPCSVGLTEAQQAKVIQTILEIR
jgi:perosamine synthetase